MVTHSASPSVAGGPCGLPTRRGAFQCRFAAGALAAWRWLARRRVSLSSASARAVGFGWALCGVRCRPCVGVWGRPCYGLSSGEELGEQLSSATPAARTKVLSFDLFPFARIQDRRICSETTSPDADNAGGVPGLATWTRDPSSAAVASPWPPLARHSARSAGGPLPELVPLHVGPIGRRRPEARGALARGDLRWGGPSCRWPRRPSLFVGREDLGSPGNQKSTKVRLVAPLCRRGTECRPKSKSLETPCRQ